MGSLADPSLGQTSFLSFDSVSWATALSCAGRISAQSVSPSLKPFQVPLWSIHLVPSLLITRIAHNIPNHSQTWKSPISMGLWAAVFEVRWLPTEPGQICF